MARIIRSPISVAAGAARLRQLNESRQMVADGYRWMLRAHVNNEEAVGATMGATVID
ncbi:hypothetical protein PUN4_780065 [Paraburkholderia unamae]|nr:hypothetical protein PUN4_780065 [Paraburkholderia unamae]